ncbi:pyruvate decarboxylase [Candidatus Uhrbacteria bacterium]|nr:pyruvate decarboxylase [Candidatus Uhrbacteria bacterium]
MTIGSYLASRLVELGVNHYFAVPGDYNLSLLDEFLKNSETQLISCSNELNAGYAADGYARMRGIAATVVTYSVGSLSQINAIAGCYAESLPVIVISGGPNTNSTGKKHLLHHSLGEINYRYVRDMFAHVTAAAVIIDNPQTALRTIDDALCQAVTRRKPVYIEIACNLSTYVCDAPARQLCIQPLEKRGRTFFAAVTKASKILNAAQRPLLISGIKLRSYEAVDQWKALTAASRAPLATMPNAKGIVNEQTRSFLGVYWGPMSSPCVREYAESSDCIFFAGPAFTDYTTCGYTIPLSSPNTIVADPHSVTIGGKVFLGVPLVPFLEELSKRVVPKQYSAPKKPTLRKKPVNRKKKVTISRLYELAHEYMLNEKSVVVAETGDSWFECLKLSLPDGARFEIQMQYGSIGWSVGATLGAALGSAAGQRPITFVGDGSFQMSAQELSTIIRYHCNPIIFLVNNQGYQIEERIHVGVYNTIENWNYADLVPTFNGTTGKGWSAKVTTEGELVAVLKKAATSKELSFIEVMISPSDNAPELITFGKLASAYNQQPYEKARAL